MKRLPAFLFIFTISIVLFIFLPIAPAEAAIWDIQYNGANYCCNSSYNTCYNAFDWAYLIYNDNKSKSDANPNNDTNIATDTASMCREIGDCIATTCENKPDPLTAKCSINKPSACKNEFQCDQQNPDDALPTDPKLVWDGAKCLSNGINCSSKSDCPAQQYCCLSKHDDCTPYTCTIVKPTYDITCDENISNCLKTAPQQCEEDCIQAKQDKCDECRQEKIEKCNTACDDLTENQDDCKTGCPDGVDDAIDNLEICQNDCQNIQGAATYVCTKPCLDQALKDCRNEQPGGACKECEQDYECITENCASIDTTIGEQAISPLEMVKFVCRAKPCVKNKDCTDAGLYGTYCHIDNLDPNHNECLPLKQLGDSCLSSDDCAPGLHCPNFVCVAECIDDAECPKSQYCNWYGLNGSPTIKGDPNSDHICYDLVPVGGSCKYSNQCLSGLTCSGGKCSKAGPPPPPSTDEKYFTGSKCYNAITSLKDLCPTEKFHMWDGIKCNNTIFLIKTYCNTSFSYDSYTQMDAAVLAGKDVSQMLAAEANMFDDPADADLYINPLTTISFPCGIIDDQLINCDTKGKCDILFPFPLDNWYDDQCHKDAQACDTHADCTVEKYCDPTTKKCFAKKYAGESAPDVFACFGGYFSNKCTCTGGTTVGCPAGLECESMFNCAAPKACGPSNPDCPAGKFCNIDNQKLPINQCLAKQEKGKGCVSPNECITDMCFDGKCDDAYAPGTKKEGESCTANPKTPDCVKGFYCDPAGNTCSAQKKTGDECAFAVECLSIKCTANKCEPMPGEQKYGTKAEGVACTDYATIKQNDCSSGLFCSEGTQKVCVKQAPVGESCSANYYCISNSCDLASGGTKKCLSVAGAPGEVCSPACNAWETCSNSACKLNAGACKVEADCAAEATNKYCNTTTNKCEAPKLCTDAKDCTDAQYCATTCKDKLTSGLACTAPEQCFSSEGCLESKCACTDTKECPKDNYCAAKKCTAKLGEGGVCTDATKDICLSGECKDEKCVAPATGPPPPAPVCTPTCTNAWEECQAGTPNACKLKAGMCNLEADCAAATDKKTYCNTTKHECETPKACKKTSDCTATQYCDTKAKACKDKLASGLACEDATQCLSINGCTNKKCACEKSADCPKSQYCGGTTFECIEKTKVGDSCPFSTTFCKDICISGIAKADPADATKSICICDNTSQCEDGKYCSNNGAEKDKCVDKLAEGAKCAMDGVCKSGKCLIDSGSGKTEGVCSKPAAVAPGGAGGGTPVVSILLPNFLGTDDPSDVIGRVINYIVGLAGTAAMVMFIYGGAMWLISAGRPEYVSKGRDTMMWAAIGLFLIFTSYVLIKFIVKLLGSG